MKRKETAEHDVCSQILELKDKFLNDLSELVPLLKEDDRVFVSISQNRPLVHVYKSKKEHDVSIIQTGPIATDIFIEDYSKSGSTLPS